MKKVMLNYLLPGILFVSCHKQATDTSSITLTASSTHVSVGQTITVTANTRANAISWSVNPTNASGKAYDVTTEKTNYISFSKPGNYVIGVRVRSLDLDSVHHCNYADSTGHHLQDSVWNHHIDSLWVVHGFHRGDCKNGIDSASVRISVK